MPRVGKPAAAANRGATGLFPEVSPHDSDCELLDVDPMSIDEYMNRLYARTQRNGSKTRKAPLRGRQRRRHFPSSRRLSKKRGVSADVAPG